MPYMNVDDQMHGHRKFVKLGADRLEATGLWVTAGSWCASALTDGFVPDYIVRQWDPEFRNALRLCDVGLWTPSKREDEDGFQFHDWTENLRNPTAVEVREKRANNADRQRRYRNRQKKAAQQRADQEEREDDVTRNALRNGVTHASPGASQPSEGMVDRNALRDGLVTRQMTHIPTRPDPLNRGTTSLFVEDGAAARDEVIGLVREPVAEQRQEARADVEAVCLTLADHVQTMGGKRPTITKAWRDAIRLLIDRDLSHEADAYRLVVAVLDWAIADPFWAANILSAPTLRKQFTQLRAKRRAEHDAARTVSTGRGRNGRRPNADDKIRDLLGDVPAFPGGPPQLRAIQGGDPR